MKTKNSELPYLIELFNCLESLGWLSVLYRSGHLSKRAQLCRDAFLIVHREQVGGAIKTVAVTRAAEECCVSETTIYNCLREVKEFTPESSDAQKLREMIELLKQLVK